MFPGPHLHLPIPPLKHPPPHLGIMQQPQRIIPPPRKPIKPPLLQPQPHRHRPHHLPMQPLALPPKPLHHPPKHPIIRRPQIRTPLLPLPPNLQALLQIRHRRPQRPHVPLEIRPRHLLPPVRHVAAVGARAVPRQRVLFGLRAREEGGGLGEDGGGGGGGDAVVGEVDKAGALEAGEKGGGGGEALGGGAGGEEGEVDELRGMLDCTEVSCGERCVFLRGWRGRLFRRRWSLWRLPCCCWLGTRRLFSCYRQGSAEDAWRCCQRSVAGYMDAVSYQHPARGSASVGVSVDTRVLSRSCQR